MADKPPRSPAWKWIGGAAVAVVALALVLAALVAFVVPGYIRTQASKGVEAATGRKLAISAIDIHPFTWRVDIGEVSLSEPGGKETFATFQSGTLVVSPSSIWQGAPIISQVRLVRPHFNVIRTGPSTYNLSDLIKYLILPIPPLSLNDVAITEGSIDFLDRALPQEERHTVRNGELMVPFLTTIPALASQFGNPRFSALIDGAPLVIEAQVRGLPRDPEVFAHVDLRDVSVPGYLSYLPARIPVQVDSGQVSVQGTASYRVTQAAGPEVTWDGTVEVTGIEVSEHQGPVHVEVSRVAVRSRASLGKKMGMILDGGTVEIRDLSVPFGGRDGMKLGLLSITGARFVERENRLEVADLLLADGKIRFSRDRKGVFSPMPLLERLERTLPRASPSPGAPVQYRVRKLEGRDLQLAFTDGTRKDPARFDVSGLSFKAEDIAGPLAGPIAFSFGARIGKNATFEARGKVVPTPLAADVDMELKGLALAAGGPYLPEGMGLSIAGGRLDLRLAVDLATRQDRLTGTWGGSATLRAVELLDRGRGKLVAWDRLSIEGVKGTLEPMTLLVGKVGLFGLRANLVMDEGGKINLPEFSKAPAAKAGKRASRKDRPGPGLESLRVGEVVVSDGAVSFTDKGVPGGFRATIGDISARVAGLTTEPGRAADVRVRLVLPKGALLSITGKVAPLQEQAGGVLALVLENLDLTTATPYTGVHLGLEVDRGSLTVKSRVRIDQGKLAAENRIRVEQLTFGKAVKSDKATILPVRLLVDIMRDRNGDIVLDLPVEADTDDEDLVGNLVGQVVTEVVFPPRSPVRNINFSGCSADLDPDAQGRLRKLAEALQERPAMKLTAIGYVDREQDGKACRAQVVVGKVAGEKPPAPPLEGDARMKQLAEGRAAAVRDFLVLQGAVEATRVSAATGDVYAAPRQKGERQARVEFARATD